MGEGLFLHELKCAFNSAVWLPAYWSFTADQDIPCRNPSSVMKVKEGAKNDLLKWVNIFGALLQVMCSICLISETTCSGQQLIAQHYFFLLVFVWIGDVSFRGSLLERQGFNPAVVRCGVECGVITPSYCTTNYLFRAREKKVTSPTSLPYLEAIEKPCLLRDPTVLNHKVTVTNSKSQINSGQGNRLKIPVHQLIKYEVMQSYISKRGPIMVNNSLLVESGDVHGSPCHLVTLRARPFHLLCRW